MAVFTFDMEANREKIQAFRSFIDDNRLRKGVLMPVLQDAQSRFGYLPKEVLEIVSKELTPIISARMAASRLWACRLPHQ